MISLPDDLPVLERDAVRLVVTDDLGRLLLLRTHDITDPALGEWWELPGGGIDAGETHLDAALRELREETGIEAAAAQVGPPAWRRTASFRYRHGRRLQRELVVRVALDRAAPALSNAGQLDYEREDYLGFRWWSVDEILTRTARFYPGRLPELLPRFLAGDDIDEAFELWS